MRVINYTLTITVGDGCSDVDTFDEPDCQKSFTGDYAAVIAYAQTVQFSSSSDNHLDFVRIIRFTLEDGPFSEDSYTVVTIIPVTDVPVVDLSANDPGTENDFNTLMLADQSVNFITIVVDEGYAITNQDS